MLGGFGTAGFRVVCKVALRGAGEVTGVLDSLLEPQRQMVMR